jgi:hypothetical protein
MPTCGFIECEFCVAAFLLRGWVFEKNNLMERFWIKCRCGNVLKRRRVDITTIFNCPEDYKPAVEIIRQAPAEANPPRHTRDMMLTNMIVRKRNCDAGGIPTPGLEEYKREVRESQALRELGLEG